MASAVRRLHHKGTGENYLQKLNLWITFYLIISLSAVHLINFMEKGNKDGLILNP
jgi:hypothetical protein